MHSAKPLQCATPRVIPNVNYEFGAIMMHDSTFISCNECPALAGDVDDGGGCACMGARGMWETSAPSLQFSYEPNTALKSKVYLRKPDLRPFVILKGK